MPPHVCLQSVVLLSRLNNLIVWQSLITMKDALMWFLQTEKVALMSPSIGHQANRKDLLCKDSESIISFEFSSFSSSPATAQSLDAIECLSVVVLGQIITLTEINVHTGLNPSCCALWTRNLVNMFPGFQATCWWAKVENQIKPEIQSKNSCECALYRSFIVLTLHITI